MFKRMQSMQVQAVHSFQTIGPDNHEYRAIIAIHNTNLGPALGGCRCLHYAHEQLAFDDVMRLAQGMSYKAALAKVPQGGGKSVILLPNKLALEDIDRGFLFTWFGQCVEQLNGQYITAMDVGTQVADMDVIAKQTVHVASASNIGDPAQATAQGVMTGIRAALDFYFSSNSSSNSLSEYATKRFAIQGLGHVGWRVAQQLKQLGADVIAADPDKEKCRQAQALGIEIVDIEEILFQACDVLIPCALGGVIDDDIIDLLECKIIAGSANNQLSHDGIAQALAARNILYTPDYIINAGGLIFASSQYYNLQAGKQTSLDTSYSDKIESIYQTLMEVFILAKAQGENINQVANELALRRLKLGLDDSTGLSNANEITLPRKGNVYDAA